MAEKNMTQIVIFILVVAASVAVVMSPNARSSIQENAEYLYEKIKCIFGKECTLMPGDEVAADSTKALACAIDVTAYWSDTANGLQGKITEIEGCKKTPPVGNCEYANLFTKTNRDLISSCLGKTSQFAPKAIATHSGGILSRLSEWSGGGNKITGNAVGNKITGYATVMPKECSTCGGTWKDLCWLSECTTISNERVLGGLNKCEFKDNPLPAYDTCEPAQQKGGTTGTYKDWCATCGDGATNVCDSDACYSLALKQKTDGKKGNCAYKWEYGVGYCTFVEEGTQMCGKCSDAAYCTKDYCELQLSKLQSPFGSCKAETSSTTTSCTLQQNAKEKEAYEKYNKEKDTTAIEKMINENPGRAMAFGKTAVICDAPGTPPKIECTVEAFELPQYVNLADENTYWVFKIPLKLIDWARATIGFTGDPKYLVYYEKFPEEAEAWWTYDAEDPLYAVFVVGAVTNLGIGTLKVGGAVARVGASRIGGKLMGTNIYKFLVRRSVSETEKAIAKQDMRAVLAKSIADNFGGKEAVSKYLRALRIEQTMFGDVVNKGVNDAFKEKITKDYGTTLGKDYWKDIAADDSAMRDIAHAVQGAGTIDREVVERILKDHNRVPVSGGAYPGEYVSKIVDDMNEMKGGIKITQGEFTAALKKTFTTPGSRDAFLREFTDRHGINKKLIEDSLGDGTKGKIGVVSSLRWIAKKFGWKKSTEEALGVVDGEAAMAFSKIENVVMKSGETIDDTVLTIADDTAMTRGTLRLTEDTLKTMKPDTKKLIENGVLKKNADELLDAPAKAEVDQMVAAFYLAEGDTVMKEAAWARAKKAINGGVKGFVGLPPSGIPSVKRTALLAGTYLSAWYFMEDDMEEEKYLVHQNTVTLYKPRMYGFLKGDTPTDAKAYLVTQETKGVKPDTLVQMKIPKVFDNGGMPLALASPCKADVKVSYGTDCKCGEFYIGDAIAYKLQKIMCVVDMDRDGDMTTSASNFREEPIVPVVAPGICPTTVKWRYLAECDKTVCPDPVWKEEVFPVVAVNEYEDSYTVKAMYPDIPSRDDPAKTCKPKPNENLHDALLRCLNEEVHDASCTDDNPGDDYDKCLKEIYRDCYGYFSPSFKDCNGITKPIQKSNYPNINSKQDPVKLLDTIAVPLNVFAAPDGTEKTYKVCTEQGTVNWIEDRIKLKQTEFDNPCIKIEIADGSMDKYTKTTGVDPNYCRINKGTWSDYLIWPAEAGVLVGSAVLSAFPPTMIAGEAVSFVGGGLLAVGWKYIGDDKIWPNSQI